MPDKYAWSWVDCSDDRVAVFKVRGELDVAVADRFAVEAVRMLRQVDGSVAVDLSLLTFVDCAGARLLAAVLECVPSRRMVDVSGIRPPVRRVLDLMGLDLPGRAPVACPASELVAPSRGQQLISQADMARWRSRTLMLETGVVMARLATTYAEIAAARERRGAREDGTAERMQALSDTARALSARYCQRVTS